VLIASMYPCPFDPGSSHDYSFALVRFNEGSSPQVAPLALAPDDVYAYEEAKCNTEKHSGSSHFPYRSLSMGFAQLNERPEDVTAWVFPTPSPQYDMTQLFQVLFHLKALDSVPLPSEQQALIHAGFVRFVPHQEAHAGLAVYTSPFKNGFYFTLDGGGDAGDPRDTVFGSFGDKRGGLVHAWEAGASRHSLSWFHERLTEYFGFNQLDNGKVSGLAAYGHVNSDILDYFSALLDDRDPRRPLVAVVRTERTPTNFSSAALDNFSFNKLVNPAPGRLAMISDLREFSPFDVAATGEYFFRNLIKKSVETLLEEHAVPRNGCFAGGVFNNVRLNQELSEASGFRSHFSMAPGDAGLALGAALVSIAQTDDHRIANPYLGPSFTRTQILRLLDEFNLPCREVGVEDVARLISEGSIVGWFVGRGEYGPRSLGARSILGDPRDTEIKARLNQLAKRRDFFMPFAPAILEESMPEISGSDANPYMQVAVHLSADARALIPAAVHVDGSSRVQVVSKATNAEFHSLITSFRKLTGVPAVLNTSFNRHGIATIGTPRLAIEHLLQGCVEHLYIDGLLLSREDFRPSIERLELAQSEDALLAELSGNIKKSHASTY